MTALCTMLLAVESLTCPLPRAIDGYLSQYGRQPTDATILARQEMGHIPLDLSGYDGLVAVADCGRIGDSAWLTVDGVEWYRVVIFDCAGNDGTPQWMERNHILCEVDYYLALRLGIVGRGGIAARMRYES